VRLLRVLALALVDARGIRNRLGAVQRGGLGTGRGEGLLSERRRVGTHIGDVPVFVQRLGDTHGLARGEAQLARRFLLQRRGRERCCGAPTVRLRGDLGDLELHAGVLQRGGEGLGGRSVEGDGFHCGLERAGIVEVATGGDALTVESNEFRVESLVVFRSGCRQAREQVPIAGGDEREALLLPVDDEAGSGALHAAGGQAGPDLAPQHRRDFIAINAVEVAGVVRGGEDRVFGDLVEHHALDRNLGLQHLQQVPGDGLALAVLISCEQELVRVLQRPLELADGFLLGVGDDVVRFKTVVDIDRESTERTLFELGRQVFRLDQIANVTDR
jgi:hypothetical protein